MDNQRASNACGGCLVGCHRRSESVAQTPAPRHLTRVVAVLYGLPLVVLAAAVAVVQAAQLGPVAALCGISAALALSLIVIARYGEIIERLLTPPQALQRTLE